MSYCVCALDSNHSLRAFNLDIHEIHEMTNGEGDAIREEVILEHRVNEREKEYRR